LRDYGTATWQGGDSECDHLETNDTRDPTVTKQTTNAGTSKIGYKDVCGKCGAIRIDEQIGLEVTPDAYIANLVEAFRECKRILRDDGTLWVNIGDSFASVHTGGIDGLKPKDLIGIPWMLAFALRADGWYLRQDIIWAKPNPMPESVKDRCTKSHEYIFLLSKSARYYYDNEAVKEPYASEAEPPRDRSSEGYNESFTGGRWSAGTRDYYANGGRNKRSVWTVSTRSYSGAHFATYPPDLIEPCILAGCPPDGTVLDPFVGSGTTCVVAGKHGRNCIGLDLNFDYLNVEARKRLSYGSYVQVDDGINQLRFKEL